MGWARPLSPVSGRWRAGPSGSPGEETFRDLYHHDWRDGRGVTVLAFNGTVLPLDARKAEIVSKKAGLPEWIPLQARPEGGLGSLQCGQGW